MVFRFFVYGALGWCAEIVWTALTRRISGRAGNWLLIGETSLWAFPMYGSIALLYEPLHNLLRGQSFVLRASAYLLGFWAIEYLGGWLVWKIAGQKPWDYSRSPGGNLHGLIRWNFIFIWPWVGLALEPLHDLLVRLTPLI
ncbi:MAG TPA: hypothetical protein VF498_19115 [Anaerolineales bacterium]